MISKAGWRSLLSRAGEEGHARYRLARDLVRSLRDVGIAQRLEFQRLRRTGEYREAYTKDRPLVSILIATYNRGELLRDRAVRSSLAQTYSNLEIIVVGDCCTDATQEIMHEITDPRVRFVNLPQRGDYPADPGLRWMVAGTAPVNHALSLAKGDFITHLDDDDEHAPQRVQTLLDFIRETNSDLVYHPFRFELPDGTWRVNEARSFRMTRATTSSIFYHRYFRNWPWDPLAYRLREPGDWNRLRKIAFLGAKIRRNPEVLLAHYRERNQAEA